MFRQGRLTHFVGVLCGACIFSSAFQPAAFASCTIRGDSLFGGEILLQVIDCEPLDSLVQRVETSTWLDKSQEDNFKSHIRLLPPDQRVGVDFDEDYGGVIIAKILSVVVSPEPLQTRVKTNQKDYPRLVDNRYDNWLGKTYAFHVQPIEQNKCYEFTQGRQLQMRLNSYCCDISPASWPCALSISLRLEKSRK